MFFNTSKKKLTVKQADKWLTTFCERDVINKIEIIEDDVVDVYGNIRFRTSGAPRITSFPFKFGRISGNFVCKGLTINTAEHFPDYVAGEFNISDNQLTFLSGCPNYVGSSFLASNNQLTSLIGSPVSVGGVFDVDHNMLTNFEGMPETIENAVFARWNQLTSLKGLPNSVDELWVSGNNITSFVGGPKHARSVMIHDNPIDFKDIHKFINIQDKIFIGNRNSTPTNLLYLLLVDGLKTIVFRDYEPIASILNQYLNYSDRTVAFLECQDVLIDSGQLMHSRII